MRLLVITFLLSSCLYGQSSTYSENESRFFSYIFSKYSYSFATDTLQYIADDLIDSCKIFLQKYPNNFTKNDLRKVMIKIYPFSHKDTLEVLPVIDSVLSVDQSPHLKLAIGSSLVTNPFAFYTGLKLLREALNDFTNPYDIYLACTYLGDSYTLVRDYPSAGIYYKKAAEAAGKDKIFALKKYSAFLRRINDTTELRKTDRQLDSLLLRSRFDTEKSISKPGVIGSDVFHISMKDLNGNTVPLKNYAGKTLVIDYFYLTCSLCHQEFPDFAECIQEFPEVVFIFVDGGFYSSDVLKRVIKTRPEFQFLNGKTVLRANEEFEKVFITNSGAPKTFIVDSAGKIKYNFDGFSHSFGTVLRNTLGALRN